MTFIKRTRANWGSPTSPGKLMTDPEAVLGVVLKGLDPLHVGEGQAIRDQLGRSGFWPPQLLEMGLSSRTGEFRFCGP
jgi:hypothetical protein